MSTTNPAATADPTHLPPNYSSSQLPFELEREICEIAASASPKSIPTLVLIARRFRIWFEPELYRMIRCGHPWVIPPIYVSSPGPDGCIRRVLDKERVAAFGTHVQHVLIYQQSPQEMVEILESCPNTSNLALWVFREGTRAPLISILEKLPLRKLSIDPTDLFGIVTISQCVPLNHPMFSNITHLDVINCTSPWAKWEELALLPKLTHLALALYNIDQGFIDCVLTKCGSLELLILFYDDVDALEAMPQKDSRVVLLEVIGSILEEGNDWENGARGKGDFWIQAESIKQREIQLRLREAAEAARPRA